MPRPTSGLLLLAALAVTAASAGPFRKSPVTHYGPALIPGDTVPAVSGTDLEGKESAVSYAAAKLTLVNFWATWCVPCREEMPALEKLRSAHEGAGLQIVGALLFDETTPEQVAEAVKDSGVTYRIVAVPPGATNAWGGLTLIPTTFLVDGQGKLVRKFVGTDEKSIAALTKDVGDYLAGRPLGNPYIPPSAPAAVPPKP
ncbi:MAG TPA: TlpA disulfide reductase family protein [Candidatus Polarisedimenticolaceae bacterium]|nr:TlpA disulfide reductase family protein [Candidatus Polarisedimenticolaceae bacterium]